MSFLSTRQDLDLIASLVPQGASALDIGCGDGTLLKRLRDQRRVQ
ncbi:MAG: methionine biosynthesis protein MetW, partial [Pseudomonadota bacterium]